MFKPQIPSHLQTQEWARMPKPRERFMGLSRTTLLELAEAGRIRSVSIRKPGAVRGVRLLHVPSLLIFLDNLSKEGSV
jgi:hypothetical protein